ncbi:DNA-binding MarR family transcriptional regulator [Symbiobacterium terraclitae]|uniref:DNA-binding MarR family transcriptional regulator n=1 Tax=Symbiobacterium terraclitae TaxID=557451 RepID=A0ABS4JTE5_9FIRM|nr:hypothetical protein [Symbiobacterium terraclitae]MBP2017734.1 DNA-binding MarR family transcriptional regulator [Symbiobacterium terraclitae]
MRLRLITVPDRLWTDRSLPEGAKLIWCYVSALSHMRSEFTLKELRQGVGISLPSLHKYLDLLSRAGWLIYERVGLRVVRCQVVGPEDGPRLTVPSDILFDPSLPRGACWTWGLILRMGGRFEYQELRKATGYSQDTLGKHVRALIAHRWLVGGPHRKARRVIYSFRGANPHAVRRARDLRELELGLQTARITPGYSQGQYILARMLREMYPGVEISENQQITGLDNLETGGRMHFDIYISEHRLAIEFHGNQHAGPTDLYPSVEEFLARRKRDLIKLGRCQEMGIALIPLWAKDLSCEGILQALGHRLRFEGFREDRWHVIHFLEQRAEWYRKAASRGQRSSS